MGATDVFYVSFVAGDNQVAVLGAKEKVLTELQKIVEQCVLASFDTASHYLPSQAAQHARQASLPEPVDLKLRLDKAIQDLPVHTKVFALFLTDIETTLNKPLLPRSDLEQTSQALAVDALLLKQDQR